MPPNASPGYLVQALAQHGTTASGTPMIWECQRVSAIRPGPTLFVPEGPTVAHIRRAKPSNGSDPTAVQTQQTIGRSRRACYSQVNAKKIRGSSPNEGLSAFPTYTYMKPALEHVFHQNSLIVQSRTSPLPVEQRQSRRLP